MPQLVDFTKNAPYRKVNLLDKELSLEDALQLVAEKAGDNVANVSVSRTLVREIERLMDVIEQKDVMLKAASAAFGIVESSLQEIFHKMESESNLILEDNPQYLMVGYGETDFPEVFQATTFSEVRDGFHQLIYGGFTDEDPIRDAGLIEYMVKFVDPKEWSHDNVWNTTFEIGGITVYKLYGDEQ